MLLHSYAVSSRMQFDAGQGSVYLTVTENNNVVKAEALLLLVLVVVAVVVVKTENYAFISVSSHNNTYRRYSRKVLLYILWSCPSIQAKLQL